MLSSTVTSSFLIAAATFFETAAFSHCGQGSRVITTVYGGRRNVDPVVGYVPDGLTPEQYAKIKKEELDKKKKMDYGAWGPRFSKSGRPDGDWMVIPSLWTSGFASNSNYSNRPTLGNSNMNGSKTNSSLGKLAHGFRKMLPVYIYNFSLIEMVATTIHVVSNKKIAISLLSVIVNRIRWQAKINFPTSISVNMIKFTIGKSILALFLVKPCSMIIEKCNRNRSLLWSPRRTMIYGSLVPIAVMLTSMIFKIVMNN